MKFVVTFVRQSRYSRRRVGKAATQVIDTNTVELGSVFHGLTKATEVEAAFEQLYAADKSVSAKVVDVRLLTEDEAKAGAA